MPRVGIRAVEDAGPVAVLRRAWTEELAGGAVDDPNFEIRFAAWWDDEADHRTTWVAFDRDDHPVGMVSVVEFRRMPRPGRASGRWGYLANMFVLHGHRDDGIGRLLLDTAVAAARARGYVRLALSPTEQALPFYRRAGFDGDDLLVLPLA